MKKRLGAGLMALLMFVLSVSTYVVNPDTVKAEGGPIIKLHYSRDDGKYDDWSAWLWEEGGDGADYPFEEEDGDMVATMEVTPGVTSVGFIVRTQDWDKDVDADQFIDISAVVTGTVDVYVESGVEGYKMEYGKDAVTGTKLKTATYSDDENILIVTMTGEIEGDVAKALTIKDEDGNTVEIDDVENGDEDYVYNLSFENSLDVQKSYTISYDGTEYDVKMPIYYSTEEFENEYTYTGDDLGATYSKESTTFRVWAPTATKMMLNLYKSGDEKADDLIEQIEMKSDVNGTWVATKDGDLNGTYYTYTVTVKNLTSEVCDPYARTTGINGKRAMVIDLDSTNPEGWDADSNPHAGDSINDAIIYEGQIRDLTCDEDSGIENKGKYLGLTETGTTTSDGVSTGLDHIKELGITHLHILPFYDFGSVDESYKYAGLYNWGYDPVNYNVPEGSYSTDPSNGETRVSEVKQMVKTLHDNDISVVMDVVYNHVQSADDFCFNKLVPGYFSRVDEDGNYSNGSGCGNDTASERSMVRKYIVESVLYWATEYHIDGFRFDLVGLLDVDTVNEIVKEVHAVRPDVIFYGEGWSLDTTVTKDGVTLATQQSSEKTPGFAYFNDTIRDALKGSVFDELTGYVSGAKGKESTIEDSFMAKVAWCSSPAQTINYASCHDNNTLYDRIKLSRTDASEDDIIKMNNLAAAIYMTAEGVPFMQAGEEMLRTKVNDDGTYNSNSYNAGDEVNAIDWDSLSKKDYSNTFEYYKGLIAFRKAHEALRLSDSEDVEKYVSSVDGLDDNVVGFDIDGSMKGEDADEIYLVFNANEKDTDITLPEGKWNVYVDGDKAGTEVLSTVEGKVKVSAISTMILVRETNNSAFCRTIGIIILLILLGIVVGMSVYSNKKEA